MRFTKVWLSYISGYCGHLLNWAVYGDEMEGSGPGVWRDNSIATYS